VDPPRGGTQQAGPARSGTLQGFLFPSFIIFSNQK
jgi:hypothetical protein